MKMQRLRALIRKELLELKANPRLLPIVIVAPVIQLVILGYAATMDVKDVPLVVADADRSTASRTLIERFDGSRYFSLTGVVTSTSEVGAYLDARRAWLALAIPAGYGRDISAGRPAVVQILADGSDGASTQVALGYANALVAAHAEELAARAAPAGAPRPAAITPVVRVWFNSRLESRDFMVPGILALLLMVITGVLSSMAIVGEKELGTLEQLSVTPLRRWELITGKLLPYALIGILDIFLVIGLAVVWFEVPLRGSVPLLIGLSVVYLLNTLGIGLLVSPISQTQQQAMLTTVFFFMAPMLYLSGFVFPVENMPAVIQPIAYAIPLTYYLVIVRGIFLKGVGLETLWPHALALLGLGVAILGLATARARKRQA
jgi:ABC-2 type transport system permease protein